MFLPAIRVHTSEPVALLMDNCSGHDLTLSDPLGQVSVFLFPPNCTSVYQPLDQGQYYLNVINTIPISSVFIIINRHYCHHKSAI